MVHRFLLFAFFGLMASAALGCHRETEHLRPPTPVRVQPVAAGQRETALRYSGRVSAMTEVSLAFKVGGYVDKIPTAKSSDGSLRLLQAGDRVSKSEVLAELRRNDFSTRRDELRGMRANARSDVAKAKLDFDRSTILLASKAISQAAYDADRARYESLMGAASAADARVDQAGIALSDAELRSPLEGIVLQRSIEVGNWVAPGTAVFTVADTANVKVVFGVPDSIQSGLIDGASVGVVCEGLPGRQMRGRITKIEPRADSKSRVFDVEATVANPDGALKVGMVANVEFAAAAGSTSSAAPADVIVPLSAIVEPGGTRGPGVFVLVPHDGGDVVALRPVVLGHLVQNDVSVVSGLTIGDPVIVRGASIVRDGERVAVIP